MEKNKERVPKVDSLVSRSVGESTCRSGNEINVGLCRTTTATTHYKQGHECNWLETNDHRIVDSEYVDRGEL